MPVRQSKKSTKKTVKNSDEPNIDSRCGDKISPRHYLQNVNLSFRIGLAVDWRFLAPSLPGANDPTYETH
jgi:hypothetical protein